MSLVLRLDANALDHFLSLAGPEVKIELTNAIIAAAAKRHVQKAAPQQVELAVNSAVNDILAGLNNARPSNSQAVQQFRLHVANVAKTSLENLIKERVDETVADLGGRLEHLINSRVDFEVTNLIAAGVKAKINGLLAAAAVPA